MFLAFKNFFGTVVILFYFIITTLIGDLLLNKIETHLKPTNGFHFEVELKFRVITLKIKIIYWI